MNSNVSLCILQFTILLVGYFVLGPSDLYKVVKEVGKLIQNFRTLSTDLTKTVETNLESQLEIEEIRKAQRELTDAFSFRRTINVDDETEAFSTKASEKSTDSSSEGAAAEGEAAAATGAAVAVGKKKRIRRRVKKKVVPPVEETPPQVEEPVMSSNSGVVEDLDMTAAFNDDTEADSLREERMERLKQSSEDEQPWFNAPSEQEENRFAAQTSQSWNEKIMANEDKLSPLATVMERLAILEEEKIAADERLEEEFRLRTELEEKFYKEKRDMLEEAAAAVQAQAFAGMETTTEGNNNNSTTMQA